MENGKIKDFTQKIEDTGTTIWDFIKNIKLSHILSLFLLFLLSLVIINNLFTFSYNYRIKEKLSQIEKIEEIKSKYSTVDLEKIEQEVYMNDTIFSFKNFGEIIKKGLSYIPESKVDDIGINHNNSIKQFIIYFISIEFFWLLLICIGGFLLFSKDNRKTGYQMILVSIFVGIFWYFLFVLINGLFGIQNIWWNVILNIIIFFILAYVGNNSNNNLKKII